MLSKVFLLITFILTLMSSSLASIGLDVHLALHSSAHGHQHECNHCGHIDQEHEIHHQGILLFVNHLDEENNSEHKHAETADEALVKVDSNIRLAGVLDFPLAYLSDDDSEFFQSFDISKGSIRGIRQYITSSPHRYRNLPLLN